MNIIGINTLVYMDALRDGATQSELLLLKSAVNTSPETTNSTPSQTLRGSTVCGCSIPFRNPSQSTVTSIPDSKSSLMKRNVWAHPM